MISTSDAETLSRIVLVGDDDLTKFRAMGKQFMSITHVIKQVPEGPPMVDALECVLLFHSGSPWDTAKSNAWSNRTNGREATTKVLCDVVREALHCTTAEMPTSTPL